MGYKDLVESGASTPGNAVVSHRLGIGHGDAAASAHDARLCQGVRHAQRPELHLSCEAVPYREAHEEGLTHDRLLPFRIVVQYA